MCIGPFISLFVVNLTMSGSFHPPGAANEASILLKQKKNKKERITEKKMKKEKKKKKERKRKRKKRERTKIKNKKSVYPIINLSNEKLGFKFVPKACLLNKF